MIFQGGGGGGSGTPVPPLDPRMSMPILSSTKLTDVSLLAVSCSASVLPLKDCFIKHQKIIKLIFLVSYNMVKQSCESCESCTYITIITIKWPKQRDSRDSVHSNPPMIENLLGTHLIFPNTIWPSFSKMADKNICFDKISAVQNYPACKSSHKLLLLFILSIVSDVIFSDLKVVFP